METTFIFPCAGEQLVGILHSPSGTPTCGVVIVVAGGPQYRIGANRQFVRLARALARDGISVLRFDYRAMGDSTGAHRGFMDMDADIRAAVDELCRRVPSLTTVVLYGECESASAITFYAHTDPRISKVVLINPWVYTSEGRSRAFVRHYYLKRLRSREFWHKVWRGEFEVVSSVRSLLANLAAMLRLRRTEAMRSAPALDLRALPLPVATVQGLRHYPGDVLFVISGRDIIAREFDDAVSASDAWKELMAERRVIRHDIAGADHSFTKLEWWRELAEVVGAAVTTTPSELRDPESRAPR